MLDAQLLGARRIDADLGRGEQLARQRGVAHGAMWKYGTRPDVSTKGYSSSDSGLSAGSMYEQMGL